RSPCAGSPVQQGRGTSRRGSSPPLPLAQLVLDLLAGLLRLGLRLVRLALRLELLVARCLAGCFLDLALHRLGGVLRLVAYLCHGVPPRVSARLSEWRRRGQRSTRFVAETNATALRAGTQHASGAGAGVGTVPAHHVAVDDEVEISLGVDDEPATA